MANPYLASNLENFSYKQTVLSPTHRTKQSSVFDKYFVFFSVKTLEKQVEVKKTSRVNFSKP
jgi:hypothetical protein